MPRSPARSNSTFAVSTGVAACEVTAAISVPPRCTVTPAPKRSSEDDSRTVVSPARTALCTPGSVLTRVTPSAATRYTWISPISGSAASVPAEAVISTSSSAMSRIERTNRRRSVSSLSATTRRRPPSVSTIRTSRPSGVHAGTPGKRSIHTSSVSVCNSRVAPEATSAARVSSRFWSRGCTFSSGSPPADQCTLAR